MSNVVIATYEAVGEGADLCAEHFDAVSAARVSWFALCKEFGAVAFRPGHDGRPPRSFLFVGAEPPAGWVLVGRPERDKVEAKPHKGTKIGKAALAKLDALLAAPSDHQLTGTFGYHDMPTDGRSIYFATATEITFPTRRFFLRFPIAEGSSWRAGAGLAEVRESDFMRALEDHNAEAKRQQAALTAEAA